MSTYLIDQLAPALAPHCNVKIIDYWVDDLAAELKQAKVFLYDSAEYWLNKGVSEGFGLPPLEAAACGCTVFTSINDALSDNFAPGINCQQINTAGIDYDMQRIKTAVKNWPIETDYSDPTQISELFEHASERNLKKLALHKYDI